MKPHIKYLQYILTHKWYVLLASFEVGLPLWRALLHDWDKFMPWQWSPYVRNYYNKNGGRRAKDKKGFGSNDYRYAWLRHQKNKHHWQSWVSIHSKDQYSALTMPEVYVREMIADWIGAGMAINGEREFKDFYRANKHRMLMHADTEAMVENILEKLK